MNYEIIKWNRLTEDEKRSSIQRPVIENSDEQGHIISRIFEAVESEGDEALRKYTKMYDGVEMKNFLMSDLEIESALKRVPGSLIQSIKNAIENVKKFHQANYNTANGITEV